MDYKATNAALNQLYEDTMYRDPYINAGRSITSSRGARYIEDPWARAAFQIGQGLIGGGLQGYGRRRASDQWDSYNSQIGEALGGLHQDPEAALARLRTDPRMGNVAAALQQDYSKGMLKNQLAYDLHSQKNQNDSMHLGRALVYGPDGAPQFVAIPQFNEVQAETERTKAYGGTQGDLQAKAAHGYAANAALAGGSEAGKLHAQSQFGFDANKEIESGKAYGKTWGEAQARSAAEGQFGRPRGDREGFEDDTKNALTKLPAFKMWSDTKPLFSSMKALAGKKTRAADLLIIGNFARINDPGSTVREGEIKLSQSASPWLVSMVQKAKSEIGEGGFLTDATRKALIDASAVKIRDFENSFKDAAYHAIDTGRRRYGAQFDARSAMPYPLERPAAASFESPEAFQAAVERWEGAFGARKQGAK